jgi:phage shock protein A
LLDFIDCLVALYASPWDTSLSPQAQGYLENIARLFTRIHTLQQKLPSALSREDQALVEKIEEIEAIFNNPAGLEKKPAKVRVSTDFSPEVISQLKTKIAELPDTSELLPPTSMRTNESEYLFELAQRCRTAVIGLSDRQRTPEYRLEQQASLRSILQQAITIMTRIKNEKIVLDSQVLPFSKSMLEMCRLLRIQPE